MEIEGDGIGIMNKVYQTLNVMVSKCYSPSVYDAAYTFHYMALYLVPLFLISLSVFARTPNGTSCCSELPLF